MLSQSTLYANASYIAYFTPKHNVLTAVQNYRDALSA